jgi:hypothetical protein
MRYVKYVSTSVSTSVATGATGIVVTEELEESLQVIPGNHSTDCLQKTAVMGETHIIREVLKSETSSLNCGIHHWFKRIMLFLQPN